MRILAMVLHHLLLLLLPLPLTASSQQDTLQLHHPRPPSTAVSVPTSDLPAVASTVSAAETWLKSRVLSRYPSTNISTIVVGRGILCSSLHEPLWRSVLPAARNLHYSLTRWGLAREIKISTAVSSDCLLNSRFRDNVSRDVIQPLLGFIRDTGSAYSVDHHLHSLPVFFAHRAALHSLGFSGLGDRISVVNEQGHSTPINRRLFSKTQNPPLQFAPVHGGSFTFAPSASPAVIPGNPPDDSGSIPFAPDVSPILTPANPPDDSAFPPSPCLAPGAAAAPAPEAGEGQKQTLWCVAKPAVPNEKLQEGMDYACGEGGADCEEIMPDGKCYYPDNLVAHASYAFNSYWQKTKLAGGSCSFDGTALLINSDPSFLQCQFMLS